MQKMFVNIKTVCPGCGLGEYPNGIPARLPTGGLLGRAVFGLFCGFGDHFVFFDNLDDEYK